MMYMLWLFFVHKPQKRSFFTEINEEVEHNGHVEAAAALARVLGAALSPALQPLAAAQPGTVHCTWLIAVACCVLSLACSSSLLSAYAWYVTVMGMLQLQLCVVQAQAAILVSAVDAAPLFGMLTLCSITLQSFGQVTVPPTAIRSPSSVTLFPKSFFHRLERCAGAVASKWMECTDSILSGWNMDCVGECMLWGMVVLQRQHCYCRAAHWAAAVNLTWTNTTPTGSSQRTANKLL